MAKGSTLSKEDFQRFKNVIEEMFFLCSSDNAEDKTDRTDFKFPEIQIRQEPILQKTAEEKTRNMCFLMTHTHTHNINIIHKRRNKK